MKDIFNYLGLTREILRYYEEIGLVKPQRGQSSKYREAEGLMKGHQYTVFTVCWCPFVICTNK